MPVDDVLAGNFIEAGSVRAELDRLKPLYSEKGGPQNLTSNSSSLQNVTGVVVPVVNGKTYAGRVVTFYFAGTTADIKFGFNFPGGTLDYQAQGIDTAAAATFISSRAEVSDTTRAFGGGGLASERTVVYDLRYTCTADGSLQLRAAQNTPTVEVEVVSARSYILLHEVNY